MGELTILATKEGGQNNNLQDCGKFVPLFKEHGRLAPTVFNKRMAMRNRVKTRVKNQPQLEI